MFLLLAAILLFVVCDSFVLPRFPSSSCSTYSDSRFPFSSADIKCHQNCNNHRKVGRSSALADVSSSLTGWELYSRYFLAGGACASFSHGISVPFDVVKTKIQTDSATYSKDLGVLGAARKLVQNEGASYLLKGMGPTLLGYCIQGSLKYGCYEIFKPLVSNELNSLMSEPSKVLVYLIAGGFAELIGSTALTPFEAVRIRLVANPQYANGFQEALARVIGEEGSEGLFQGLPAILAKGIPYTMVQLSTFEFLTSSIYTSLQDSGITMEEISSYKYGITTSAALVAAFLSSLASQPGDTLLSKVNQRSRIALASSSSASASPSAEQGLEGSVGEAISPLGIMSEAVRTLRFRGLFTGTKARLVHVTIIVVVQLLVYDFVKQLCGIAATGAH